MGRFIKTETPLERIRSAWDSLRNLPALGKLYIVFFIFLFAAITMGTLISSERRNSLASEASVIDTEGDGYLARLIRFLRNIGRPPEPTVNSYHSESCGIDFSYPKAWEIKQDVKVELPHYCLYLILNPANEREYLEIGSVGDTTWEQITAEAAVNSSITETMAVSVGGQEGVRYISTVQPVRPDFSLVSVGYVFFRNNQAIYRIAYEVAGTEDVSKQYDAIINSIKFTGPAEKYTQPFANTQTMETQLQTDIQLLRNALIQYRAEKGQFPVSLGQLLPTYLAALPVNPYTGTEYQYSTDLSSTFRLSAVRNDGTEYVLTFPE